MKNKEKEVLALFDQPNKELTSKEIGTQINKDDPSGILRDLVYFGYLEKINDRKFKRTSKKYDVSVRSTEEYPKNYEIVLNKIFTGSHLEYNLGHELINFIKDEHNQRYAYLNPWGARSKEAKDSTRLIFHIIESSLNDEKGIYELVAVSEIDKNATVYHEKGIPDKSKHCPKFAGQTFYDIFYCGPESGKAYYYTYKVSKFYRPKDNIRIIFKIDKDEAKCHLDNNVLTIDLMCNPQHSICYADDSGRLTYSSQRNKITDKEVLESPLLWDHLVESQDSVDLSQIDDEQCFSIISGRAQLEVSTSNQIAYFLGRDQNLVYKFLHDFLEINDVTSNEKFEIIREKEKNIDLLFKSEKHVVVIENKIDSQINGVSPTVNANGKRNSQLSKYYEYIEKEYSDIQSHKYFILAPEYNGISRDSLNNYESGEHYILKNYNQLFAVLDTFAYRPLNNNPSQESLFMFNQFKKSIEFLTWSKGKQREKTAYIRLKQRIEELN